MNEFFLRSAEARDLEDIIQIWVQSFGDAPEFVRALLSEAEMLPCAVCAESSGHVQSVMFAFEGISFRGKRAAYLYALCTHPDARGNGMGTSVVRALSQRCFARGAELVFLSPADAGLADWYKNILKGKISSTWDYLPVEISDTTALCEPISPSAYFAARRDDTAIPQQLILAQSVLHRFFGGGFFRISIGSRIAFACTEPRKDGLLVRELLCPEHDVAAVCGTLSKYYGTERILLRKPAETGSCFVYITKQAECEEAIENTEISAFSFILE